MPIEYLINGGIVGGKLHAMRSGEILAEGDGAGAVVDAGLEVEVAGSVDQNQLHLLRRRKWDQFADTSDGNGVVHLDEGGQKGARGGRGR